MSRLATEFVGTFFLVLVIGLSVTQAIVMAPLAIGAVLVALVYMGGPVSGAHYNPAVSVALVLRGVLPARDLVGYVAAQLVGAMAAAATSAWLTGSTFAVAPTADLGSGPMLVAEVLFTFALVLVILNVATDPATQDNDYYGLAIGLVVMGGAWAVGPISGAAFNPAVGTAPNVLHALAGAGSLEPIWIYWVGPMLGAVGAVGAYRLQHPQASA